VRINSLDTLKSKNVAIQDLSGRPFFKVIYGGGIPTFIVGIPHFSGLILYSRDRVDTVYQDLRVREKPNLQQGRDGKSRVFNKKMVELQKDIDPYGGLGFFCWSLVIKRIHFNCRRTYGTGNWYMVDQRWH
jgi:hypothetical protein